MVTIGVQYDSTASIKSVFKVGLGDDLDKKII